MTTQYTKAVIDCAKNSIVHVPMTEDEILDYHQVQKEIAEKQAEFEAKQQATAALKESAKAKMIAGEPLTEEEAEAIAG